MNGQDEAVSNVHAVLETARAIEPKPNAYRKGNPLIVKNGAKSRQAIMAYILAMPGSTQIEMIKNLGINSGVVSTNVRMLMGLGVLKTNTPKKHGAGFYFFNQPMPPTEIETSSYSSRKVRKYAPHSLDKMTAEEVAKYAGVHRTSVYKKFKEGHITGEKIGGHRYLFDRESVVKAKQDGAFDDTSNRAKHRKKVAFQGKDLSLKAAGDLYNLHPSLFNVAIRGGLLKAEKRSRSGGPPKWFVSRSDLKKFMDDKYKGGGKVKPKAPRKYKNRMGNNMVQTPRLTLKDKLKFLFSN